MSCPNSLFPSISASLANTIMLLSRTQARSALALKRIVKLSPTDLHQILPSQSDSGGTATSVAHNISHKERLRAAVRGALGSRHPHEADLSDSQFLGRTTACPQGSNATASNSEDSGGNEEGGTLLSASQDSYHNPVDEM